MLTVRRPFFLDIVLNGHFLDVNIKNVDEFSVLSERAMSQFIVKSTKYIKRTDDLAIRPVTVWVVADLESKDGQDLYSNAIKSLVQISDRSQ